MYHVQVQMDESPRGLFKSTKFSFFVQAFQEFLFPLLESSGRKVHGTLALRYENSQTGSKSLKSFLKILFI